MLNSFRDITEIYVTSVRLWVEKICVGTVPYNYYIKIWASTVIYAYYIKIWADTVPYN